MDIKITCILSIQDPHIKELAKSINPENNVPNSKTNQKILSTITDSGKTVSYSFVNFTSITTLRLTLDDLLSHLSLSNTIYEEMKENKN